MEDSIKVVIADDRKLFREAIGSIIGSEENIQIVGEVTNGLQAIFTIDDLKPDVVLLGIILRSVEDINFISPIREKSPHTKPILLTKTVDESLMFRALEVGVRGYISKDTSVPELVKAIHAVHQGELWAERKLIAKYFDKEGRSHSIEGNGDSNKDDKLTSREIDVLKLLTTGCTNKEIAQGLFISEKTVKSHLNRIFKKLKVTRRLEATLCAINKGLC